MISIDAYRAVVGSFYSKISCTSSRSILMNNDAPLSLLAFMLAKIAMLSIDLSFMIAILLVIGGIEQNPGPTFQFSKIIFASSNQSNFKYGDTAGLQCACNSLISACWSLYKKCTFWTTSDLDCILDHGDTLLKSLGLGRSVFVDELPTMISIKDCVFDVKRVAIETTEVLAIDFCFFKDHFNTHSNNSNAVIFFTQGFAFSLLWSKRSFIVTDSHSHNEQGLYFPNGHAVSIHFSSMRQVHKYFIEKFLLTPGTSVWLQLVFVNVSCNDIKKLKNQFNLEKRRLKWSEIKGSSQHTAILEKKREKWSEIKGSSQHTAILEKKREKRSEAQGTPEHKAILEKQCTKRKIALDSPEHSGHLKRKRENAKKEYAETISTPKHKKRLDEKKERDQAKRNLKFDGNSRIKIFKEKVLEGPYFICVVCNRASYRQMFLKFNEAKFHIDVPNFHFSFVSSFDDTQYICKTCDKALRSKSPKMPCQAVCNKLELFYFPSGFENINRLERVLISKRILFKKIAIMPKGQFPKVKGAICNIPVDAKNVSKTLPRPADNNGLLLLKLKRKLEYSIF